MTWYKGNIHTHTTESDGDGDPEFVTNWFKEHGYDFLVLSDHNHRTLLDHHDDDGPLMIPGEEVSARIFDGKVPIHINGIGISRVVEPIELDSIVETIQANVDAILQADSISSINHPNYGWAFDHNDLIQINGASLLEVYNAAPFVNNQGGAGKYSTEEIWDGVLSEGKVIFGVASDDSHHYYDFAQDKHNPGRGWVVVEAEELTQESIIYGLRNGLFYSSTGVELESVKSNSRQLQIMISEYRHTLYRTVISREHGNIFAELDGPDVEFDFKGNEVYVRATVFSSNGRKAWTQPVFLPRDN